MEKSELKLPSVLNEEQSIAANEFLAKYLQDALEEGKKGIHKLRIKLSVTYWVIIFVSITMFLLGILLLGVQIINAFNGQTDILKSLIPAGFGIADLAALFFYRPTERLHKIMGDMSQIILALDSFQSQLGLRLMETASKDRKTMGIAAEKISQAAELSIKLIQDYFEPKEPV
jgi:hypothetical protein